MLDQDMISPIILEEILTPLNNQMDIAPETSENTHSQLITLPCALVQEKTLVGNMNKPGIKVPQLLIPCNLVPISAEVVLSSLITPMKHLTMTIFGGITTGPVMQFFPSPKLSVKDITPSLFSDLLHKVRETSTVDTKLMDPTGEAVTNGLLI